MATERLAAIIRLSRLGQSWMQVVGNSWLGTLVQPIAKKISLAKLQGSRDLFLNVSAQV